MKRIHTKTQHTLRFTNGSEYSIRLIAQCGMKKRWVGMGYRDGPLGYFDRFESGLLGTVRHINNHAHAVHFFYDLLTKSRNAAVLLFIAASRQQALVVITELHNAHTQLMKNLYHLYVIFNRRAILKTKDNTHFAQTLGLKDICRFVHRYNEITMIKKMAIPMTNIFQGLAAIFPVGNGDMDRM